VLKEFDRPGVRDDQLLVRVRAASLNPADWTSCAACPNLVRLIEDASRALTQKQPGGGDLSRQAATGDR
jgi:NADPH:quinone reductase-like Zn-dependent oxidoreductase